MPLYIIRLGIKTPPTECVCGSMPPYEMLSTANIITIFEITNSYQKNLQFFRGCPGNRTRLNLLASKTDYPHEPSASQLFYYYGISVWGAGNRTLSSLSPQLGCQSSRTNSPDYFQSLRKQLINNQRDALESNQH